MRRCKKYTLSLKLFATTRSTVLIHGESGTGKHVLAHAIHECDEDERAKPFVEVSLRSFNWNFTGKRAFCHVKGLLREQLKIKSARFELADKGTIFLDEIDAFTPNLQVKLLRILQEGEFERVGESTTLKVDVRVIAATNQDLQELISKGKFREDLFYRLHIIPIEIPPLRDRKWIFLF